MGIKFKKFVIYSQSCLCYVFLYSNTRARFKRTQTHATVNTVELHLSGITGTASHPYIQTTRITGFSFENTLQWQSEVEKKFLQKAGFRLHIYLRKNKTLIHNSLHVFDN